MKKPTAPKSDSAPEQDATETPIGGGSYALQPDGKLTETDPPTISAEEAHFAAWKKSKGE